MRVGLVAVLLASLAVTATGSSGTDRAAALPAKIIYVNVGQGDGVVMRIGGKIIVSDTGEFRYENLDEALKEGLKAKRIDVLILSHAHDDHARNAARLLREWSVGRVVMNQSLYWEGTEANKATTAAIRAEPNVKRTFPVAGKTYDWGGAEWIFANPRADEFLDSESGVAGNSSLVYLLRVNGVTALFSGDIEETVSKRVATILDSELDRAGGHLPRDPPRVGEGLGQGDARRRHAALDRPLRGEEQSRAPGAQRCQAAEADGRLDLVYRRGGERERRRLDLGGRRADVVEEPPDGAVVGAQDS